MKNNKDLAELKDEEIMKRALKEWKLWKIDELNGMGVRGDEFAERSTPSEATIEAIRFCIVDTKQETLRHVLALIDRLYEDVIKEAREESDVLTNEQGIALGAVMVFKDSVKEELTALTDSTQDVGLTTVSSMGKMGGESVQLGNSADSKPVDTRKGCKCKLMEGEVCDCSKCLICQRGAKV